MLVAFVSLLLLQSVPADLEPLVRVVDLYVGETTLAELYDGSIAEVKLLDVADRRDSVIDAVREIICTIVVNGDTVIVRNVNYNLPVRAGGMQLDCPAAQALTELSTVDAWGLEKDARVRLWPAESPYIRPGTFVYPMKQRWFASDTQFSNEPVAKRPNGRIYYHDGMDFGASEGLDQVVSASAGRVVSVGEAVLEGIELPPLEARYDVVYVRDARGWFHHYGHLASIDAELGDSILAGDPIGLVGKEGTSGGWSHLHYMIKSRQPSGKWGTLDSYAFLWQAYQSQYKPTIVAIARPHHLVRPGELVELDGSRSWSATGGLRYEWMLSDGTSAKGATVRTSYEKPGTYSEILKVTDSKGHVDYDFAQVRVQASDGTPPAPHMSYYPTFDIRPGDDLTFKVRTRTESPGFEIWDFGDGSAPLRTASNPDPGQHAPDGYSALTHRYEAPGDYIVTVRRSNEFGMGTARLHVSVEEFAGAGGRPTHQTP